MAIWRAHRIVGAGVGVGCIMTGEDELPDKNSDASWNEER